jgi:Transglycosylase SLT domain
LAELGKLVAQLVTIGAERPIFPVCLIIVGILSAAGFAKPALAGNGGAGSLVPGQIGVLDRVAYAVDGAESSHGANAKMWRSDLDGPQGPMQVSAAAAVDAGGGDRFDEVENRVLGRAYLQRMFRRYGSWSDAVAAYNWGPGRMDDWIGGGRQFDKLPLAVARYRARVMVASGLEIGSIGNAFFESVIGRLTRLRLLAKRELAERRHRGRGTDAVEQLYAEIMRSTELR